MVGEDLTGGGSSAPGTRGADGGAEGSSGGNGSNDGGSTPSTPGSTLPPDGRLITFEDGALVHASTGVDSIVGPALLTAGAGALAGKYSLGVDSPSSYAVVTFPPTADLFLSFHLRLNRMTDGRVLGLVFDRPGSKIEVKIEGNEVVGWFEAAGTAASFGSASISSGTAMRVGVHYHAGTTQGEINLFTSKGGGPLDRAGGTAATTLRATVSSLEIGATDMVTVDGVFDDIRISTSSFGD